MKYNKELEYYNHLGALIAWNISVNMSPQSLDENERYTITKNIWNNHWCSELLKVYHDPSFGHSSYPWDMTHLRQLYLICRGPRFTSYQLSNILTVLSTLQELYNSEVCISSLHGKCMRMEPNLNRIMENTRDEGKLREAWITWHQTVGTKVKPLYASLVRMLNTGAKQAGYKDMGQCWREETEIGELRQLVTRLYADVKYLYTLLHSFVRHKLEKFYGIRFHQGLIPAHLLGLFFLIGNMWAQKWDSLIDIVFTEPVHSQRFDGKMSESSTSSSSLVNKILPKNATVIDMVKEAENFFVSMGFPTLPNSFWKNSYFQEEAEGKRSDEHATKPEQNQRKANSRNCHGSAANMYGRLSNDERDYRMMMCAQVNDEDLITIQHEVGHIMYFMAYADQPTIFQEGANSAFHESVGDAITYDLRQHQDEPEWIKSLLKTGLAKLPQIGFGLLMDLWRWEVFENPDKVLQWNDVWWEMNEQFLGITKPFPGYNTKDGLDAAGKFHIIDNIPYIRYFLASFLQLQFYESMCKATENWDGNLHTCRIKGSKPAGAVLWNMMEKGTSRRWSEILEEMTGSSQIDSRPLLQYFEPLKLWLEREIRRLNLTVGCE
ncbi:Angiotensin-converting enzyme [Orchesella cincta]|uniref:Angiotensin-converting enzyme n=1 Tax=Orchesella cincta TaxID=48709 RepID=A0A1D2MWF6_ORCCI|nr:Angiotensin-converting enzyme [Orchesella cincta]